MHQSHEREWITLDFTNVFSHRVYSSEAHLEGGPLSTLIDHWGATHQKVTLTSWNSFFLFFSEMKEHLSLLTLFFEVLLEEKASCCHCSVFLGRWCWLAVNRKHWRRQKYIYCDSISRDMQCLDNLDMPILDLEQNHQQTLALISLLANILSTEVDVLLPGLFYEMKNVLITIGCNVVS